MHRPNAVVEKGRALWSGGRGMILVFVSAGWALTIGGRMIYPILLPDLRRAYDLDFSVAGILLTVLFFAYAIGQLPSGVLADRIGERTTLAISMIISIVALMFVIAGASTPMLFLATALFGFGIGLYAIARFTVLASIYSENFGTAAGISNSSAEAGQALLPPLAGAIAASLGWRFGFAFVIPFFVLVTIAIWLVVPPRSPEQASAVDRLSIQTIRYVLSVLNQPSIRYGLSILIIGISVWQAFSGFYPTYLIEVKGLSGTTAGILYGLYFFLTALIHPISGAIYDRSGIHQTFVLVAISMLGLALLPFTGGFWALVGVTILISPLLAFATPMESYLVTALPEDLEGTGYGIMRTVAFGMGAISPILFGTLADWDRFDEGFLALSIALIALIGMAIRLPPE